MLSIRVAEGEWVTATHAASGEAFRVKLRRDDQGRPVLIVDDAARRFEVESERYARLKARAPESRPR